MSYGSMHTELVKKLQEFQDIEVFSHARGGIIPMLWGYSGTFVET